VLTFGCTALPRASTWTGRQLKCKPCFGAPATGPGSAVSLDPAWSPDGASLAYVKAPAYRAAAGPSLAWFQAHQLYVWNSRTDATRRIGAINGSSLPTWSRNGKSLLYVSGDGLWLADATGKTVEIEHPLYRESTWKTVGTTDLAFYGQIPWSRQFSWYTQ
jgi:Tol biopolymer transport system component